MVLTIPQGLADPELQMQLKVWGVKEGGGGVTLNCYLNPKP